MRLGLIIFRHGCSLFVTVVSSDYTKRNTSKIWSLFGLRFFSPLGWHVIQQWLKYSGGWNECKQGFFFILKMPLEGKLKVDSILSTKCPSKLQIIHKDKQPIFMFGFLCLFFVLFYYLGLQLRFCAPCLVFEEKKRHEPGRATQSWNT